MGGGGEINDDIHGRVADKNKIKQLFLKLSHRYKNGKGGSDLRNGRNMEKDSFGKGAF